MCIYCIFTENFSKCTCLLILHIYCNIDIGPDNWDILTDESRVNPKAAIFPIIKDFWVCHKIAFLNYFTKTCCIFFLVCIFLVTYLREAISNVFILNCSFSLQCYGCDMIATELAVIVISSWWSDEEPTIIQNCYIKSLSSKGDTIRVELIMFFQVV